MDAPGILLFVSPGLELPDAEARRSGDAEGVRGHPELKSQRAGIIGGTASGCYGWRPERQFPKRIRLVGLGGRLAGAGSFAEESERFAHLADDGFLLLVALGEGLRFAACGVGDRAGFFGDTARVFGDGAEALGFVAGGFLALTADFAGHSGYLSFGPENLVGGPAVLGGLAFRLGGAARLFVDEALLLDGRGRLPDLVHRSLGGMGEDDSKSSAGADRAPCSEPSALRAMPASRRRKLYRFLRPPAELSIPALFVAEATAGPLSPWLFFAPLGGAADAHRRLATFPTDWSELSDEELMSLYNAATRAKRPRWPPSSDILREQIASLEMMNADLRAENDSLRGELGATLAELAAMNAEIQEAGGGDREL